jgi:hypothetical protein
MKIDAVGIGAYLESSKIKPTSKEIYPEKMGSKVKENPEERITSDKIELSAVRTDLAELLSPEEEEFLEKLFGYEQNIRSLNNNLKFYTKEHNQDKNILGTKIDLIA